MLAAHEVGDGDAGGAEVSPEDGEWLSEGVAELVELVGPDATDGPHAAAMVSARAAPTTLGSRRMGRRDGT